ncbi:hypothetical protein ABPG73_022195 [Tetrahymena malaccensis]
MIKQIVGKLFNQLKNIIFLGGDDIDESDSFIPKSTKKYDKIMELENGEVLQLQGFSSVKDSMNNKIGLTEIELFGFFPRVLLKYIKRIGTWLILFTALLGYIYGAASSFLLQNIYSYTLQELFQIYLIPMFISIIIFFMREVFFEFQKKKSEYELNNLQCIKFKSLKKTYQKVKAFNSDIIHQISQLNREQQQMVVSNNINNATNNNNANANSSNFNTNNIQAKSQFIQQDNQQNISTLQAGRELILAEKREGSPVNDPYLIKNNKVNNILNNLGTNNLENAKILQKENHTGSMSFGINNQQNVNAIPNQQVSNFNSFYSANVNGTVNYQNLYSQQNSNQQSYTNIPSQPPQLNKYGSEQQKMQQNQVQVVKTNSNQLMPSQNKIQAINGQNINSVNIKKNKNQKDLSQSINLNNPGAFIARRQHTTNNSQANINKKRTIQDKKIEEQNLEEKLQKYNSEKIQIVEQVCWKDLQLGDIVILKRGQVSPADLLILESKGGRISVDCQLVKGVCDEAIKKPTMVTSISDGSKIKQSVFEYRKILNGKLEYSSLKLKDGFKGFIKLSKDPKGEEIDNYNVIYRGSVLRNCKWVYGLVIYAGHDCRIFKQSRGMTSLRKSFFASKAQTFYTISLFQIMFNILVSMLFLYFQPCNYTNNQNYPIDQVQLYIVSYLMDYLNILPPLFYATIDIIDMINDIFQSLKFYKYKNQTSSQNQVEQQQKQQQSKQQQQQQTQQQNQQEQNSQNNAQNLSNKNNTKNEDCLNDIQPQEKQQESDDIYKLTRSVSISDISLTNHVFFDKTGTITEDKFEVKSIFIKDSLYMLPDHDKLKKVLPNYEKETNAEKSIKSSIIEQTNFPTELTEEKIEFSGIKPSQDSNSFKASITYLSQQRKKIENDGMFENENLEEEEKDIIKSNLAISNSDEQEKEIKGKNRNQNRQPSTFFQSNEEKLKKENLNIQPDPQIYSPSNLKQGMEGSNNFHGKRQTSQTESDMHIHTSEEQIFMQNLFDEYDGYYHQAILSLILCHQTNTGIERSQDNQHQSIKKNSLFKIEKEIMQFAECLGYQFKWNNSSKGLQPTYHLKICKKIKDYHILAVNEYTEKRKRMSVLIRDPNSDSISGAILIVRQGLGQTLPENLKQNIAENDKLSKINRVMESQGTRRFIYMKKELTEDQCMEYVQKYENAHKNLISNVDQREEIYNSIENDLELICVIGLQEKIRPDVEPLIHSLNVSGIGTWMLSGDNFENNLGVAYQIGFVENDQQVLHFNSEDADFLKLQIRQQLQLFKSIFASKEKSGGHFQEVQNNIKQLISHGNNNNNNSQINLTQNGQNHNGQNMNSPKEKEDKLSTPKSLNQSQNQFQREVHHKNSLIENSSLFQSNFHKRQTRKRSTSAWNLEKNLPQYSIFISGKSLITIFSDNYLKDHFSFLSYFAKSVIGYDLTPQQKSWFVRLVKQTFPGNQKTLSVGDSYNDCHMMQETDVSIQIENCRKTSISELGDIIVKDFKTLQRLIFLTSRFFSEVYEELLLYCFYRSFLLAYMILFFNLIDCTYASSIFSGYDILNYNTVFFIFSIIPYTYKKYRLFKHYQQFKNQDQIVEQFKYNIKVFKKKKTMLFLYKVVGHSFLESLVLFVICYFNFNFGSQTNGKDNSLIVLKRLGLIMITFWSQVKFNIANNQSYFEIICSHTFHFIGVIVYLSFGAMIDNNPSNFVELGEMIQSPQMYITIFSLAMFAVILQIFLENNMYIQKFFPFPYIIDRELYSEIKGEMNELKFIRQTYLEKAARNNRPESGLIYYKLIIENHLSKILNQIFKGSKQENMDQILQNLIQSEDISISQQDMSKVTLKFKNRDLEKKFLENLVKQWEKFNMRSQISILFFLETTLTIIGVLTYQIIIKEQSDKFQNLIIPQSISIVVVLVLVLVLITKRNKLFFQMNISIFFFRILFKIIQDLVSFTNLMLISIIYSYTMNFAIIAKPHLICIGSIMQNIIFIPLMIAQTSSSQSESSVSIYVIICAVIYIINFMVTLLIQKYTLEQTERNNFLQFSKMQQETQKVNNVLSILLPKFVRERISAEQLSNEQTESRNQISEDQGEVAVLFLLICDFDEISQSENEKIVMLLDNLFRYFDNLCSSNDVTKIETVGNSYVCAAGLKSVEEQNSRKKANAINPVRRMINLAFDMKNYVQNIKWGSQGQSMVIKIGIHYGKVMAGVIGYHKPQFSLIGDTVNTTSRVMSTGENGKITLSKQAFDQVSQFIHEQGYSYQQKNVEAKGKGILETFQIFQNKKNQLKQDKRRTLKTTLYQTYKKQTQYEKGKKSTIRQNPNSPFRNNSRAKQYKKTSSNIPSPEKNDDKFISLKQQSLAFNSSDGVRSKNQSTAATHGPQSDSNQTINDDKQQQIMKKNSLIEIEEETSKISMKDIDSTQKIDKSLNFNQIYKKLQIDPSIINNAFPPIQEELYIPLQNSNQNNAKETTDADNNEDEDMENFKKNSNDQIQNDEVISANKANGKTQNNKIENSYLIKFKEEDPITKIQDIEPNGLLEPNTFQNNYGRRRMQRKITRMINDHSPHQIQHSNSVEKNIDQLLKPESKTNIERHSATRFIQRNSIRGLNIKSGLNSQRSKESKIEIGSEVFPSLHNNIDQSAQQLMIQCNLSYKQNDEIQDEYIENDRLFDLYDFEEEKQTHENLISFKKKFYIPYLDSKNPYVIQFSSQIHKDQSQYIYNRVTCLFLSYSIKTILQLFNLSIFNNFAVVLSFRGFFILILLLYYILRNKYFQDNITLFRKYVYVLYIFGILSVIFESSSFSFQGVQQNLIEQVWQLQAAESFFLLITLASLNNQRFEINLLFYMIMLISWIILANESNIVIYVIYFFIYGGVAHGIFNYILLGLQINNFNTYQILKRKNNQQASLLNNLLPLHILDKFLNNRQAERMSLTDQIDNVTILFADISQFTKYSSQVQPEQVVKMLRSLFYEFDRSVQYLNLFKLYTIGDCYVVLSFNDINKRNIVEEAKNVIYMGLEMIRIIRNVRSIINFEELDMRIGVHTGRIIGGVIGTDIVRYDVYGSDVTIANKMESNGERGKILISQVTYDLLANSQYSNLFNFTKKEEDVYIKTLDRYMPAYFAELNQQVQDSSEILEQS